MNPNATEFKFNVGASEWKPSFSMPLPAAPVQKPVVKVEEVKVELKVEEVKPVEEEGEEEEEEEIDETDPLWQAALKIGGSRESALKLLEDPDALMRYPEVIAFLAASESSGDSEEFVETKSVKESDLKKNDRDVEKETESVSEKLSALSLSASANVESDELAPMESAVIEDGDPREHVNIVFIGHVDAGKSTLSGSILFHMGKVDKRTIEKFEREAKQRNRESWFLAYILDESEEERAKGITIEVGRAHFETETNRYTILDAPGHKNYVPNMIAGAAQADIGVLVISARKGEFETGFEKGGQTREHALLAKTLGVRYLVVVVNKMDDPTVQWAQSRYDECVAKLKPFLKSCGYTIKTQVKFLPIAGLLGDNILREVASEHCPWWKNMYSSQTNNTATPTLISTLDSLKIEGRNAAAPLRIPCLDRYFERGCVVMGKVESGSISVGEEILVAPTKKKARVEAIFIDEKSVRSAKPGENVLIRFQLNVEDIQKGFVLCSPLSVCPAVCVVKVRLNLVEMLEHRPVFSPGYDAVMHIHTVEIEVKCEQLVCVMDKGKALRRPFARQGQQCQAILSMPISTCMETYANNPALGRFTIRDEGKSIAIGMILELIK